MSLESEILRRVPRANSRITDLNFEEQILTSSGLALQAPIGRYPEGQRGPRELVDQG